MKQRRKSSFKNSKTYAGQYYTALYWKDEIQVKYESCCVKYVWWHLRVLNKFSFSFSWRIVIENIVPFVWGKMFWNRIVQEKLCKFKLFPKTESKLTKKFCSKNHHADCSCLLCHFLFLQFIHSLQTCSLRIILFTVHASSMVCET